MVEVLRFWLLCPAVESGMLELSHAKLKGADHARLRERSEVTSNCRTNRSFTLIQI